MKKKWILGLALSLLILLSGKAQAFTFSDDFNDGNTDGWTSISVYPPGSYGSWRVENGVLIETGGGDPALFAVEGQNFSDQVVEAKVLWYDMGGAGISVWHRDAYNYVRIFHRYQDGFIVVEYSNNVRTNTFYPNDKAERIWRTMKVVANSDTGEIRVYLDGDYMFTYTAQAGPPRSGLTGFNTNNAGGAFDDFRITSILDFDFDGVADIEDNCPLISNPGQENYDEDSTGDACDTDDDNDDIIDLDDCAPKDAEIKLEIGTRSCDLWSSGVPGKGILNAPGLQKPLN